jgi:hypothetical protein
MGAFDCEFTVNSIISMRFVFLMPSLKCIISSVKMHIWEYLIVDNFEKYKMRQNYVSICKKQQNGSCVFLKNILVFMQWQVNLFDIEVVVQFKL